MTTKPPSESELLPNAIWEGVLNIGGATLKVFVLDDGRRIIDAESFHIFWQMLSNPEIKFTEDDARKVASFTKGPTLEGFKRIEIGRSK